MKTKPLRVALLGFGTVGGSVARILMERPELTDRIQLTHVFNRGVERKRVDWVPVECRVDRQRRRAACGQAGRGGRSGRWRRAGGHVGSPRVGAEHRRRDREQDAARGTRARVAAPGRHARHAASVRGSCRRRSAAHPRRSRRARRRSSDACRRHSQRHLELRVEQDGRGERADERGARRCASARLRGGRPERRHRRRRRGCEARRAGRYRIQAPPSSRGYSAAVDPSHLGCRFPVRHGASDARSVKSRWSRRRATAFTPSSVRRLCCAARTSG